MSRPAADPGRERPERAPEAGASLGVGPGRASAGEAAGAAAAGQAARALGDRAGPAGPSVAYILKGYPRISETFISNEIALMEELGFTVRIVSMRHPRESFSHESVGRIKARVDYLPETMAGNWPRLARSNWAAFRARPVRYLTTLVQALGRLAVTGRAATFKHFLQAGCLAAESLPGSGVSHLHAHFAHSPASVALFASRLTGLPFSFTAHAKDIYTQDPGRLREKIRQARFVATCTGYNLEHLARVAAGVSTGERGGGGSIPAAVRAGGTPIHRVYHGIDLALFDPGQPRLKARPPFTILTVARLTAKKGLPTVLEALARLAAWGVDFRHVLIGSGEERQALERRAARLGLSGRMEWLGTQPHDRVVEELRRADLFLLACEVSANGDRDGIPNVLAEAMAMGTPVACTAVSAIPELIEDGRHGLLVPQRDPEALALAARRLLEDQALRARIIPAALARVRRVFDNRALAGELAAIFRSRMGA